jgi:FAD/FMN-containing dehydrogenase
MPPLMRDDVLAWGRVHRFEHRVLRPSFQDEAAAAITDPDLRGVLPRGCGRSYGDSGLNDHGTLIDTTGLDRFIAFDADAGELECEAGVPLAAILRLLETRTGADRWFLPVTPGTKYVTVGGAIANDVHGKNHHRTGCFGNHLVSLKLLRSDGRVLACSPDLHADLFRATIGGLGLTGLILSARLRLRRVAGFTLEAEDVRYSSLDEFYALSDAALADWEYGVAWLDCFASGPALGRGIFSRARHTATPLPLPQRRTDSRPAARLTVPWDLPAFALNHSSIAAFNYLRWRTTPRTPHRRLTPYEPVFYPLDAIGSWNRIYGARGFYQFQCVVPNEARQVIRDMLVTIQKSGEGSFLAVLKTFGATESPGMLSFPMPGVTLALDFPNRGSSTTALLAELERISSAAGGRIYPAKDGCMSASAFQNGYPLWRRFSTFVDPNFSSSFWRRVAPAASTARREYPVAERVR